MSTALVERIDLPPDASSVRRARTFVTSQLSDWGCDALADTAALLTSELVTNVVLHARTAFAIILTRTLAGARIDVLDKSDTRPVLRAHDLAAPTGRGLALVACLSSQWGATPADDLVGFSKGVRFSLG